MPNIDGGHYFYTGLFPVLLEPVARDDGSVTVPAHLLRESLASLPNYSHAAGAGRISPFARSRTTHFARLAVIDDPAFNGRDPVDAIKGALKGVNLQAHQPVDYLSRPWLMFAADFDLAGAGEGARDRWAEDLWSVMADELNAIFCHCAGFEAVRDGAGFAAFLKRGQLETTMSFNDYWIDPMPGASLGFGKLIGLAGLVTLAFLAAAFAIQRMWGGGWLLWTAAAFLGLGAGIWAAYRTVMRRGARPFPAAPDSDLRSVLKGLYLQQQFARFAVANQGAAPEALHAAFGRFLAEVRPDDPDGPTQHPGVLKS